MCASFSPKNVLIGTRCLSHVIARHSAAQALKKPNRSARLWRTRDHAGPPPVWERSKHGAAVTMRTNSRHSWDSERAEGWLGLPTWSGNATTAQCLRYNNALLEIAAGP